MDVSLIIPAYNEGKKIENTIDNVLKFMKDNFTTYQIIVVDDGSNDNTEKLLHKYFEKNLKIISLNENMGKGKALKTGIEYAEGKYCFFIDADLPYPLEGIIKAMDIFKETGADLIIGSRVLNTQKSEKPYPFYRQVMSRTFSYFINSILDLDITDTQCGFKGFTRQVAKKIFPMATTDGFGFDFEILYIAKKYDFNIVEMPVKLFHTGDSKVNIIKDSVRMIKDAFKVRNNDRKDKYQ